MVLNLDAIFNSNASAVARDLKLNLKRLLEEGALSREEALFALLATATATNEKGLVDLARTALGALDLPEHIAEAEESAAIMGMLNVYYRFRHMVGKPDDYNTAGLRMTALAKPSLGKERFEMLALAVSVINGCENCIKAHEQVLRDTGVSTEKIHDLARIAAVVKGVSVLRQNS